MDGDGHNARAFAWNDEDGGDAGKPAPAFDPAAVLRAIEDEDAPAPRPTRPGAGDADLGAALRAALDYEGGAADRATDDHDEGDANEDELALSDDHDDAEDWREEGYGTDERGASEDPDGTWVEDEAEEEVPAARQLAAPAFPSIDDLDVPGRKPRIALMGEFSAGKSTLSNLMIGSAPLPMKVTATHLPPVWISWGDGQPYREDLDGGTHPIDISRLSDIDPSETRVIRIFAKSEILELCDIIDMPGISDPNMASDVWERVIGKADAVIWCTHATQAWRQSEASVWESLDPKLFAKSLLLVTRFDKLHGETDRARVLRRVERETEGLFAARLPISLTDALSAGEDEDLLVRSGAAAFRDTLVHILLGLAGDLGSDRDDRRSRTVETLGRDGLVTRMEGGRPVRGITPSRILPRRVRPVSELAPMRPRHGDHDADL